jgi:hypothetical protein
LDCEIFHLYSEVIKHIKDILINRLQLGDEQSHDNNADNISHNYQYAHLFFVKLDADYFQIIFPAANVDYEVSACSLIPLYLLQAHVRHHIHNVQSLVVIGVVEFCFILLDE